MIDKQLFRVYDTKTKEYLFTANNKQRVKAFRNEKEYALPHFDGTNSQTSFTIKQNKHYKYRFQTRRAKDHRKGES